jgi:hypothetical protein
MAGVEQLTNQTNRLSAVPSRVIFSRLFKAEVNLTVDPSLPSGTVEVDLRPPERFDATYTPTMNNVRVTSAPGKEGGLVELRVGPETSIDFGEVQTTEANVNAAGTDHIPLSFGNLSLATTGEGVVSASNLVAERNFRPSVNAQIGLGVVVAGQFVQPTNPQ